MVSVLKKSEATVHAFKPKPLDPAKAAEVAKGLDKDEQALFKAQKHTARAHGLLAGLVIGALTMFFAYDFMAEKTMDRSRADIMKTEIAKKALEEAIK